MLDSTKPLSFLYLNAFKKHLLSSIEKTWQKKNFFLIVNRRIIKRRSPAVDTYFDKLTFHFYSSPLSRYIL